MIVTFPFAKVARMLGWMAPGLLALVLVAGCDEGYPADLEYGVRTDPLVTKEPIGFPPDPDRPGQFPVMTFAALLQPNFPLNLDEGTNKQIILDPADLGDERRDQFATALYEMFGTPAEPVVDIGAFDLVQLAETYNLDDAKAAARQEAEKIIKELQLEPETLAKGSILYRRHCLHCHGLSGDGRGPTAFWVNPHPRDYRQGIFKFTSSGQSTGTRKPLRSDLLRTLRNGIEGTSMPSFGILSDEELNQLVSYVIHLSLRGEAEFSVMSKALQKVMTGSVERNLKADFTIFINRWREAQKSQVVPGPYPYADATEEEMKESVQRGWQAFLTPGEGSCIGCHLNYGREGPYRFDAWGTLLRPANLTRNVYRGGRRPVDLYWRIQTGINGSGMAPLAQGGKSEEEFTRQIWDLVNFVQALPYPELRQKYGIQLD